MGQFLLLLIGALVVGAIVFGVAVLIAGDDPGIDGHEPDGQSVPLPATRPLAEGDVSAIRFDTAIRGYRMAQVDAALRRAAYDIGYKSELIQVLEAEVEALRDGRTEDADALRHARELASGGLSAEARHGEQNADAEAALDADEALDAEEEPAADTADEDGAGADAELDAEAGADADREKAAR
jgi:DivIVA domain-containing protein